MTDLRARLGSGRILAANALWNLAAQIVPAIVGVVTVPFIIRGLGIERFGILTLAWMVIGYFSLFDLGLGRAVTKLAAELLPLSDRTGLNQVVWTAWYFMGALGLLGALVLTALVPWLVQDAIKVPVALRRETLLTFYLLAWSVPIVVLTTGFRGVLEADQRFALVSTVRLGMGLATFIVPLLVLQFSPHLTPIIAVLIVVRLAAAIAYLVMCHRVVPELRRPTRIDRTTRRRLFGLGAWMTVSNLVSPLMDSVDRFLIGALISVAAVAYYATPFDTATKLLVIPSSVAAVVFPAFSAASVANRAQVGRLFRTGVQGIFAALYPAALITIAFAPDLLRLWLGQGFAQHSALVLRVLMLGVLSNGLAAMPFAFLQGLGRADLTGRLHLVEAPVYFVLLTWLVKSFGINGAAFAWVGRTTLDMLALYWLADRHLFPKPVGLSRRFLLTVGFVPLLALGWLDVPTVAKVIIVSALLGCFVLWSSRWELGRNMRALASNVVWRVRT